MDGFLSKLKTVRDYVLSGARAVCGAAGALASELPEGRVRAIAERVTEVCGSLGLMPTQQPPLNGGAAERAAMVPELHNAVVRGAGGSSAE
jgi:hypothetical protein